MRVAFYTLGCKVNHYETEALQKLFITDGFDLVDAKDFADVYVINTCTVTNQSDVKSRKAIRQAIKKNPEAVIAVIGCYSQIDPDAVAAIDGVDIIMGTSKRERLLELVHTHLQERKQLTMVEDIKRLRTFDQLNVTSFSDTTRAFIKIQDGCNQYCSFCIIPFARGPIRSRSFEEILKEATALVSAGYQEIVLTGIHTGGYGTDLEAISFYDLLKALSDLPNIKRLRISSIEINQLTDDIITLMTQNPVFARHLHIPIQSGSDTILKKMRRRYTLKDYEDTIAKIRTQLPNIAITTDIITGYPEESEDDFQETLDTLKRIGFSELHVFPYSRRSGTKAALIKNQVHGSIKSFRVNTLLQLNEALANQYINHLETTPLDVLFEQCDGQECRGHTSEYIFLKVKTSKRLDNTMHPVLVTQANYPETTAIIHQKKPNT